jgi:hypothetical protein
MAKQQFDRAEVEFLFNLAETTMPPGLSQAVG